ncbi:hypothetical protein BANT918_00832 [Brevibacterium antiquum CNRZ 918]|uniref:Uncharacterized protein n=1 Tax=Brevibacterium antiquum CNRZ 918 TaxID=1255637 RepID=A0A2H1ICQ2_9MICO|nr:hypothetical protein BANT918_00832 [Brevibacterium antiquum CNRZ 918]
MNRVCRRLTMRLDTRLLPIAERSGKLDLTDRVRRFLITTGGLLATGFETAVPDEYMPAHLGHDIYPQSSWARAGVAPLTYSPKGLRSAIVFIYRPVHKNNYIALTPTEHNLTKKALNC